MKVINHPSLTTELLPGKINQIEDLRTDSRIFSDEECTQDFFDNSFYECTFTNVTFIGKMRSCQFVDVIFDHCDFSNCDCRETILRRVEMKSCRLIGTEMTNSRIQDTLIDGSNCQYATFAGSKWKQSRIQETLLKESSFSYCEFTSTAFERNDFSDAEFLGTKLKGLDFSNSKIDGFMINAENLNGVTMNADQAIACTKLLGIRIKE